MKTTNPEFGLVSRREYNFYFSRRFMSDCKIFFDDLFKEQIYSLLD